jgi:hypothetical protein
VNLFSAITAGFAVGALPFGIFVGILVGIPAGGLFEAAVIYFGLFGLFGALAGLVFWITLKAWEWRGTSTETIATLPRGRQFMHMGASAGTLILAVLLTTGVFAIPVITWDRTCHNMLRDGRTSVGSQANMYVSVGMDEWPKLTELFEQFAPAHGMSIRNSSRNQTSVRILALSLCTEQGTNIEVLDQRWAHKDFASLFGWGTPIRVYELRENSGWQKLAADLLADIGATFPGKVEFRDGMSRVIPTPPELENGRARLIGRTDASG